MKQTVDAFLMACEQLFVNLHAGFDYSEKDIEAVLVSLKDCADEWKNEEVISKTAVEYLVGLPAYLKYSAGARQEEEAALLLAASERVFQAIEDSLAS
jgi:hypothetical protein